MAAQSGRLTRDYLPKLVNRAGELGFGPEQKGGSELHKSFVPQLNGSELQPPSI